VYRFRRPTRPETGIDTVPPWEDAKLAMSEFGNWIKNADTKVTVLAAALGILVTAIASKADIVRQALSNPAFGVKWTLVTALGLLVVAVLVTAVHVYRALAPRTMASGANRFAWPSVAAEFRAPSALTRETCLEEAWQQNYVLAQIARAKFGAFRWALRCFGATLLLSVVTIALATWQAGANP